MLAVAGGKGGCGKTTTALGVAAAMARAGDQPLVVDCDCDMPDIHHVTGVDREPGVDALAEGSRPRDVRQRADRAGVSVITAGKRANVGPAVRRLGSWPGPVILDTPAGITPDTTRPIRYADRVLLVTTTSPQCLDDTARTATAARELGVPCAGAAVRHRDSADPVSALRWQDSSLPVLANVPTVDGDPLAATSVAEAFDRIATDLSAGHGG